MEIFCGWGIAWFCEVWTRPCRVKKSGLESRARAPPLKAKSLPYRHILRHLVCNYLTQILTAYSPVNRFFNIPFERTSSIKHFIVCSEMCGHESSQPYERNLLMQQPNQSEYRHWNDCDAVDCFLRRRLADGQKPHEKLVKAQGGRQSQDGEGGTSMCHSAVWRLACASDCCCSLFRMMLMMSPSCSFMCSISRSLLVDSKPQMQQQNRSTQYSMPGPGGGSWPVRGWLWDWDWSCAGSFPWGLTDSGDHFEGSVGGVEKPTGLSADRAALVADVGVSGGSAVLFALSFECGDTAGRSAADSTTADNFWGALKEAEGKIMRRKMSPSAFVRDWNFTGFRFLPPKVKISAKCRLTQLFHFVGVEHV